MENLKLAAANAQAQFDLGKEVSRATKEHFMCDQDEAEMKIKAITGFDYDTAWELLHAIVAKLKCRYEHLDDTAVGEAFKNLDKALCDAFGMPTNRSEHERETDRDDTSQHPRTREHPPARGR